MEEMIHKITLLPAQRTFLEGRGAIRDGWTADLVILDYDHLEDRADYLHPTCRQEGSTVCVVERTDSLSGRTADREDAGAASAERTDVLSR